MKVIKIPYIDQLPCSVHEVSEPENENHIKELKELININMAEFVLTKIYGEDLSRKYYLIVDEVGKMKEKWIQKINWRASQFYAGTIHGDPIVGDVILCAMVQSNGEWELTGLEDWEIEQLLFSML